MEPLCNTTSDCYEWLFTLCNPAKDGNRRCLCIMNYIWNASSLNCTQPLKSEPAHKQHDDGSKQLFVWIVAAVMVFSIVACLLIYLRHKSTASSHEEPERRREVEVMVLEDEGRQESDILAFTLDTLSAATEGFAEEKKLGQGGSGLVYKGLLPGGQEIAVKRLVRGSSQAVDEVTNEIRILGKLQHQNIVRLLGYSSDRAEKCLVYEYLPGKSLDKTLFDETTSSELTWDTRREIILGIARGLLYLHDNPHFRVVHLDLKPSNILLDSQFKPKIADFGLSRVLEENQTQGETIDKTGTYGYLAPEYAIHGIYSLQSDIYSFGVMVLEILSGKKSSSFCNQDNDFVDLSGYAWTMWKNSETAQFLDKTVAGTCSESEAIKFIQLGLLCVQKDPKLRPTMSELVSLIGNETPYDSLPQPTRPPFSDTLESARRGSFSLNEIVSEFDSLMKNAQGASTSAYRGT